MNIEEIKKLNWKFEGTRRMTYQKVRLYYFGLTGEFKRIFKIAGELPILYRNVNGDFSQWHDSADLEEIKSAIKKLLLSNHSNHWLSALSNAVERSFERYLGQIRKLPKNYAKYSNRVLVEFLQKFYDLDRIVEGSYWIIYNHFEETLTKTVIEIFTDNYCLSKPEVEANLRSLSRPHKMIALDREHFSMLKIAFLPEGKRQKALGKHHAKFAYMPMYDINYASHSLEYFRDELAQIIVSKTRAEIKQEIAELEKKYHSRETKQIIWKYRKDKKFYNLLDIYSRFPFLKEQKPYTRDTANYLIQPLFKEISRRTNLTLDEVLFLTAEEIAELLEGNSVLILAEIRQRVTNSVFYCADNKINIISDPEVVGAISTILERKEVVEIKGFGVNPGKVTAPVSVVLSNRDFGLFKDGNILVASATRPDYLPLMKKAAAIVTNEGGMLSHAAIVSREFGIPCVVGTKTATQVFKNGDMVEVDSDKGTVRKI